MATVAKSRNLKLKTCAVKLTSLTAQVFYY